MNEHAEMLRKMAKARRETQNVIAAVSRYHTVLFEEADHLEEAANLIDAQEAKIDRLKRIITRTNQMEAKQK